MSSSPSDPSPVQNNEFLRKLKRMAEDNAILEKQLKEAKRDNGDSILREAETAAELAELKAKLASQTADNETVIRELRLEVKQLKHSCNETNAELEEMKKKSVTVAALEDENWFLKSVADTAKVAEEKAVKEKEEIVTENRKLKRANDSIIESATVRFRDFESRVIALEAAVVVAHSNLGVRESTGQAAPVGAQEIMDHAVVYVDSD